MVNPLGAFDAPTLGYATGPRLAGAQGVPVIPQAPQARAPLPAALPQIDIGPEARGPGRQPETVVQLPGGSRPGNPSEDNAAADPAERRARAPEDRVDTAESEARVRQEALAKLQAYQAERARRTATAESDYRRAIEALRQDIMFFGSLSPVERALPEVARALQSAEVLLPLRELSGVPVEDPDPRAPFVRLAGRFLEILDEGDLPEPVGVAAEVRGAVTEEVWRVLGIARREPAFAGVFSPESESLIDRKLREAEAARDARRAAPVDNRVSVLA